MRFLSKEQFKDYINQLNNDLALINQITYDPIFGGDKYELGYRGKHHRMVLMRNGETIAISIKEITNTVIKLLRRYRNA